eukprot:3819629-Amphidinium_carterae.3
MSVGVSKVAASPAHCPVGQGCSGQPSQSVLHLLAQTTSCGNSQWLPEIDAYGADVLLAPRLLAHFIVYLSIDSPKKFSMTNSSIESAGIV